jgi:hypothetical protein
MTAEEKIDYNKIFGFSASGQGKHVVMHRKIEQIPIPNATYILQYGLTAEVRLGDGNRAVCPI